MSPVVYSSVSGRHGPVGIGRGSAVLLDSRARSSGALLRPGPARVQAERGAAERPRGDAGHHRSAATWNHSQHTPSNFQSTLLKIRSTPERALRCNTRKSFLPELDNTRALVSSFCLVPAIADRKHATLLMSWRPNRNSLTDPCISMRNSERPRHDSPRSPRPAALVPAGLVRRRHSGYLGRLRDLDAALGLARRFEFRGVISSRAEFRHGK